MTPNESMARAAAHFAAGRLGEAQELCDAILRADPSHFYALHLAGTLALRRGEFEDCVAFTTRALEIEPAHVEVLCNRGAAQRRMNRIDAALADYERALAVDARSAVALNNRGVALAALNRHREAIASYTQALAIQPGYLSACFHRSLSELVTGDLANGWEDFEARWGGAETQGHARSFAQPHWNGGFALRDKTILVHAEQGLGDFIQFSRYVPLLADRGARVVLEVHPPLHAWFESLRGVSQVVSRGDPLPAFDCHCPVMSLPRAFRTTLETIPADIPYLEASGPYVEKWRARLEGRKGPLIGLAWSGSPTLVNDRNRTIPLAQLAPLRTLGATLVSLQKDIRDSDIPALRSGAPIANFGADLADFRDTAALASLMDLVISVDTAPAHVAGAIGKPAWILLPFSPDWRWLLDHEEESPWYPTARLFRQARVGEWAPVIERVAREAHGFIA